jgi:hypothetical protein
MTGGDWSKGEVEAVVEDYLDMLGRELARAAYNKAAHRRDLLARLTDRSDGAVEFKHCNISAALLDLGFPPIAGYKPRRNYQGLLVEVVAEKLMASLALQQIAAADADRPMVEPEVDDILAVLANRPASPPAPAVVREPGTIGLRLPTNYIEREARNRSLGAAGERFVLRYEQARLIHAGHERLAASIEHTSAVRGDHEGYDILSFEATGAERLIEVKTTKYSLETPFFVTRNEAWISEKHAARYQLYRLFAFTESPRMYTLPGAIGETCNLSAVSFMAQPR